MSTIGSRLREIRLSDGSSQRVFGEKFDIPQTTYAKYEIDKAGMPDTFKQQLARAGINLHWLITSEGSMYYKDQVIVAGEDPAGYSPTPVRTGILLDNKGRIRSIEVAEGEILVPIFSQRLSAGNGQEWLPADFTDERLPLLSRFIKPYKKEDVFAAQVRGDSMTGVQLFDGDIVFFVRGTPEGDGIYVISVDGEVFVKRLEVDPFEKKIIIRSENDRYQPKIVDPDCLVVMGKVIGWLHHHPY